MGTTEISYIAGIGRHIQNSMYSRGYGLSDLPCLDGSRVGFFDSAPDPTNADSIPNTSYFDTQWSCQQWMIWTDANINAYGQTVAVQKFIQYASQVSSLASDHFCPYESDFAAYYKALGVNFDNFIASAVVTTTNVTVSAADAAANAAKALDNGTSVLTWLVPLATVAVAVGALIFLKSEFIDKPKKVSGLKRKKYGKR